MSVAPADLKVGKKYNIFRNRKHILKELTEKEEFGQQHQYFKLRFGEEDLYGDEDSENPSVITINTKREPNVTYTEVRSLHPLISDQITKPNRSIHHYHYPGHYIPNGTRSHINRTLALRRSLSQSGLLPEMQHHILKFNEKNKGGTSRRSGAKKLKGKTRKNKSHKQN